MPESLLDFNNEELTAIAGHLTIEDLRVFATVCRRFYAIAHHDAVWKEMLRNHYGVTYKLPNETWKQQYERKYEDPKDNRICPHVGWVTGKTLEPYKEPYNNVMKRDPSRHNCMTCGQNQYEAGLCLYIYKGNTRIRCRDCAYRFHSMAPNRHGILLRIPVLQMYCFSCSRLLGESRGDPSEAHYVDLLLNALTHDSDVGREALERKRQCMIERQLYQEEADRASVLLSKPCYYLIDRTWLCSWFLRLCDGKIGSGPVTNKGLEDEQGRLNPDARPRGAFSGGFSIVTPHLWEYLVKTYGLSGKAHCSTDIQGPEYVGLRQAIENWKLI